MKHTVRIPPLTQRKASYPDFERARAYYLHWYRMRKKARWN